MNEAIETYQQADTYQKLSNSSSVQKTLSRAPALEKRVAGTHAPHKGILPGNADGENRKTNVRKKQRDEGLREETEEEISQRMVLEAIRR